VTLLLLCERNISNVDTLAQQTGANYDAGVVDQYADATKRVVHPTERFLHGSLVRDVAGFWIKHPEPFTLHRNVRRDDAGQRIS